MEQTPTANDNTTVKTTFSDVLKSLRTAQRVEIDTRSASGEVKNSLIKTAVDDEMRSRISATTTVYSQYQDNVKELEKLQKKPTNVYFTKGPDGKNTKVETFDEATVKKMDELAKTVEKMEQALLLALPVDGTAPDFTKVKELANKNKGG